MDIQPEDSVPGSVGRGGDPDGEGEGGRWGEEGEQLGSLFSPSATPDVEKQVRTAEDDDKDDDNDQSTLHTSVFKSLGILDQFLALWIFLAMLVGILLGNFVPSTGPALQRGEFVGVSIPIGT